MRIRLFFLLFLSGLLSANTAAWAEQNSSTEDLDLSLEDLFSQIPMVVTASRREQLANETPASVYVITEEQIRQSGATTIPDLFRTVPGLGVIAVSAHDVGVHVRGAAGFNDSFSDKVLVMINSRSVYWDVYGTIFWDLFPISISEIKQIEIIKSPASSLYGTNAFSGVINFITKTAEEEQGGVSQVTLGENNTFIGYASYGRKLGPFTLKASGEFDQQSEWDVENWPVPKRVVRGNALGEYHFGNDGALSLAGGFSGTENRRMFMDEMAGTALMAGNIRYLRGLWDFHDWKMSAFVRGEDFDIGVPRQNQQTTFDTRTYDFDLQKVLRLADLTGVTVGGNARRTQVDKNLYIPDNHTQTQYAVFGDAEYKPWSWLTLALGGRYDWHPLTRSHFSPRASLSLKPHPEHTVRLAWGNAFRNPTLVNSYLGLKLDMTYEVPPNHVLPLFVDVLGSKDLEPEEVNSYEVSYTVKPFKRLTSSFDFYYREYQNVYRVLESTTEWYGADEVYPGSPAFRFPKRYLRQFGNGNGSSTGWGLEIQEDVLLTDWLWLVANYWYQSDNESNDRHVTLTGKILSPGKNNPPHHASAGFRLNHKDFSCQLTGLFVDSAQFFITDSKEGFLEIAEPYFLLNASMGYSFGETEIRFAVFNLLDQAHYEYPPGNNLPNLNIPEPSSDALARRMTVSLRYRL